MGVIDRFWIITSDTKESIVRPSKLITNCSIVGDTVGWTCENMGEFVIVKYKLPIFPPQFFGKLIPGTIVFTCANNETVFLDAQFRAIYFLNRTFLIVLSLSILVGFFIFKERKREIGRASCRERV